MKPKSLQRGSIYAALVIVLVVALISFLGFIFWMKFINGDGETTKQTPVKSEVKTSQDDTPEATKQFVSKKHGISFSYPAVWTFSETVTADDAGWYASSVTVKNEKAKEVALLIVGGQFGGACSDEEPSVETTKLDSSTLTIPGIPSASYSFTIVKDKDGKYRIGFGISSKAQIDGATTVKCPGMSVNYTYIATTESQVLGSATFGRWYKADDVGYGSLSEAKAYLTSSEYLRTKTMIKSLSIKT